MIRYSDEDGFIKPGGLRDENDVKGNKVVLLKVAVGVFSIKLFESIVSAFQSKKVAYFGGASYHRPIYVLNYNDEKIVLFNAGVSGPWISADIEELSFNGVERFVIFGNCGVLDSSIEDCSIIIPSKAFRDEGTSYHYLPDSEDIVLSDTYKEMFKDVLKEYSFDFVEGATWTTDAFYRETPEKIKYFKDNGAVCVEMEASVIAAVCKRKHLDYFTFYYAGDNLDAVEWDRRSISQEDGFEKKKEVPILALELASRISKKEVIDL